MIRDESDVEQKDDDICYCGHRRDEHSEEYFAECSIKGCGCSDFERVAEEGAT